MIWKTAWKNVWRNKMRSLVVIISVTIGIFGGIFAVAVMNGAIEQRVDAALNEEISHIHINDPAFRDIYDMQLIIPNPEQGKPPILLYPDECWYDGNFVFACSRSGAIKFNIPLMWRTAWKDKDTGKLSWVGKRATD